QGTARRPRGVVRDPRSRGRPRPRLEEHHPGARRAARAVLVLRVAVPAGPVLPPDPLQVLDLEEEEREDPEEDDRLGHAPTVAYERAARNGPPGSSSPRIRPNPAGAGLPASSAGAAEAAREQADQPDQREHRRDDEQPVNREANAEGDDRQHSKHNQ